jgi:hypothetical protein
MEFQPAMQAKNTFPSSQFKGTGWTVGPHLQGFEPTEEVR